MNKDEMGRDQAFAQRLSTAVNNHPAAPLNTGPRSGQQKWLKESLEKRGVKTSAEVVRRWLHGIARPRQEKMEVLAKLLEVDFAWLAMGIRPDMTPTQKIVRSAKASGAVNLVAGLLQIAGASIAFPATGGKLSGDIVAILDGEHFEISVILSLESAGAFVFTFAQDHQATMTIGVIVGDDPLMFELVTLPNELIKTHGELRGDYVELVIKRKGQGFVAGKDVVPKITDMSELGGTGSNTL